MYRRTTLVLVVVLLALIQPLKAQDTATVTDRQLRQRLDYALNDTRKSIEELNQVLARMQTLRLAVQNRITRDSIAARPSTGTSRPPATSTGGPNTPSTNGPTTPPPAASALLYGHDFNNGAFGQFGQWGDHIAKPASIVADPTGSGRGSVVRVDYTHDPASGGSHDVNHSIFFNPKLPGGKNPNGLTWGERVYWRGDFYIPRYQSTRPAQPQYDQRKLLYPKFGNSNGGWSAFFLVLWGRTDGSGMDLGLSSGRNENGGYRMDYGLAPIAFDRWHTMEVEFQINNRKQADGWIRVWVDGKLVKERRDFLMFSAHDDAPNTEFLREFAIGNQEQWLPTDRMSDYRLWDNIQFRTARP